MDTEVVAMRALQWMALILSFFSAGHYGWKLYKNEARWEILYITVLEFIKYVLEIGWEHSVPGELRLCTELNEAGICDESSQFISVVPMYRYVEWLLTCPVILIALSNLTGLSAAYSLRTMKMLSSEQGTLVFGLFAVMSTGATKTVCFIVAFFYFMVTMGEAVKIYKESFQEAPKSVLPLVKQSAWMLFLSWSAFPIMFLAGPEGLGHFNQNISLAGHALGDILSKNLWCFWTLRIRKGIREHNRNLYIEQQRTKEQAKIKADIEGIDKSGNSYGGVESPMLLTARQRSFGLSPGHMAVPGQIHNALVCGCDLTTGSAFTGAIQEMGNGATFAATVDEANALLQNSPPGSFSVLLVKDDVGRAAMEFAPNFGCSVISFGTSAMPQTAGLAGYVEEPQLGQTWSAPVQLAAIFKILPTSNTLGNGGGALDNDIGRLMNELNGATR